VSHGASERNMRLVGGRRVRVRDLVQAGLLEDGESLTFTRPRSGERFEARVTSDGRIRFPDGQAFLTPSSAARSATGGTAIDGWTAWTVTRLGELLDGVRQRYLDQVASSVDPGEDVSSAKDPARQQHVFLKEARAAAAEGEVRQLVVKDLIARWGVTARSPTIEAVIDDDLANHGLTTVPSFRKVGLDTPVLLQLVTTTASGQGAETVDSEDFEVADRGLTLGNLPSALRGVESISAQSSFNEALTKMALNDYSQLAVLSGPATLRGAVTWRSIAQARHDNPDAGIAEAILPAIAAPYDTELVDVLRRLYEDDFVFVRGPDSRIAGIVTAADVVLAYGDLSMPFLLVGQIDMLLRRLIGGAILFEDVAAACDKDNARGLTDFDELTIGDYQRVLETPQLWARLHWNIDRASFIARLNDVRELRNDIMHFNADPLSESALRQLRNFMLFLKRYVP
jgi:CBS domain-containing protein